MNNTTILTDISFAKFVNALITEKAIVTLRYKYYIYNYVNDGVKDGKFREDLYIKLEDILPLTSDTIKNYYTGTCKILRESTHT